MCAVCDYLTERELSYNEAVAYWDRRAKEAGTGPDRLRARSMALLCRIERDVVWSLQVDHVTKHHPDSDDEIPF